MSQYCILRMTWIWKFAFCREKIVENSFTPCDFWRCNFDTPRPCCTWCDISLQKVLFFQNKFPCWIEYFLFSFFFKVVVYWFGYRRKKKGKLLKLTSAQLVDFCNFMLEERLSTYVVAYLALDCSKKINLGSVQ